MNILISSGHYYLSDKYGSEMIWAIDFAKNYQKLGYEVYVVSTVSDIANNLGSKIHVYSVFGHRSNNVLIETILRGLHPMIAGLISMYIYFIKLRGNVRLVHHVSPVSRSAYDLLFLLKPRLKKTVYVIGPAFPTPKFGGPEALTDGLGTKKTFYTPLIWLLAKSILPVFELLCKISTSKADYFVCATQEAAEFYSDMAKPSQIMVIPVGVNIDDIRSTTKKSNPNNHLIIFSASKLIQRKGLDVLIKAMAELSKMPKLTDINFKLRIAGNGEERSRLDELVRENKLDDMVEFAGFVDHNHISAEYIKSDIYCSPTRYEPFGMTIVEAMAAGLPVVVSDVNSTKETIGNGGLVFPVNDEHQLAMVLKELIIDNKLRKQIGEQAAKRASRVYSWSTVSRQYLDLAI